MRARYNQRCRPKFLGIGEEAQARLHCSCLLRKVQVSGWLPANLPREALAGIYDDLFGGMGLMERLSDDDERPYCGLFEAPNLPDRTKEKMYRFIRRPLNGRSRSPNSRS